MMEVVTLALRRHWVKTTISQSQVIYSPQEHETTFVILSSNTGISCLTTLSLQPLTPRVIYPFLLVAFFFVALCLLIYLLYQEHIEPAKPAREHVTPVYTAKSKHG